MLAQFPEDRDAALAAAVYLHGLAGELGAAELGEKSLIATDLLRFFPAAMRCVSLKPRPRRRPSRWARSWRANFPRAAWFC